MALLAGKIAVLGVTRASYCGVTIGAEAGIMVGMVMVPMWRVQDMSMMVAVTMVQGVPFRAMGAGRELCGQHLHRQPGHHQT